MPFEIAGAAATAAESQIDRLPNKARAKLVSLQRQRAANLAASHGRSDERQDVNGRKQTAIATLRRHEESLRPDERVMSEMRALIARLDQQLRDIDDDNAKSEPARAGTIRLIDATMRYLQRVPANATLVERTTEPTPLKKGESLGSAVERYRHRRRELLADKNRAVSAPLFADEAKANLRRQVDELAEKGRPNVAALIEDAGAEIGFQQCTVTANDFRNVHTWATVPDTVALVCWLHRDTLIARLESELDEVSDDKSALTASQREELIEQIDSDILITERAEISLIDAAAEAGMQIHFRGDTDVRALLSIADEPSFEPPALDEPAEMAGAE